jgi:predicted metal-dependent hydrolase
MNKKHFALNERLFVTVAKRSSSRNVRLSISVKGDVRVSIPTWMPFKTGLEFARSRQMWIIKNLPARSFLQTGQAIGKAHHLVFRSDITATKVTSRIRGSEVIIVHPSSMDFHEPAVQKIAEGAAIRALRLQAAKLLPQRLRNLAVVHGFSFKDVTIKQLKGRWGSCDQDKHIVLNLFLMELSWECIDYVLLHELTHTQVMQHGPKFWLAMEEVLPETQKIRKIVRSHQPVVGRLALDSVA